jgi:multidrug efflux pump subunit AcrA (membrane-fusion protein)
MKQRATSPWLTGFLVLVVLALILSALWINRPDPPIPLAPVPDPAPVHARIVEPSDHRHRIHIYGQTQAVQRAVIAMDQSGLVAWKSPDLELGGIVKTGDHILSVDSTRLDLAVRAAKAAEVSAFSFAASQQELWAAAMVEHANAQEVLPLVQREADRQKELAETGAGSASAADLALRAAIAARGQVRRAEANVRSASAAHLAAMEKGTQAQVALDQAMDERSRAQLLAPFDGEILSSLVEIGTWISPGVPVCELVNRQTLKVLASLPNSDAHGWQPDFPIELDFPAYLDGDGNPLKVKAEFHGLSAEARSDSRARTLDLRFNNEELNLPAGAFAEIWVDRGPRTALWLRPSEFRLGDHGPEAIVVDQDHADVRQLRLGRTLIDGQGQTWHPVLDGLSAGETIAIDNLETPKHGDSVLILP